MTTTLKAYIDAIPPMIPSSIGQLSGAGALAAMNAVSLSSTAITGVLPASKLGAFSGDATNSGYTLALSPSGVTAGSFTNASITVDSKGRITSASSGSSGAITTVFGRTGAISAATGDYSIGQIAGAGALASLNGIGGLIAAGSSVTLAGSGTAASPYTISATGTPTVEVTTSPFQMAPNARYITNMATTCTLILPTSAPQGSTILIDGKGAGGWKVAQNANQTIHTYSDTTTGITGSLSSSSRYDNVALICITADTDFEATARNGSLVVA